MCKGGTNMPNIGQSRPVVLTSTTRSSGPVVCGKSAEVSVEIAVSWNKMEMETNQETKRQTNEQAMERIQEHEMNRKYPKRKRDPQEGGDRTIILSSVESYGHTSYRTLHVIPQRVVREEFLYQTIQYGSWTLVVYVVSCTLPKGSWVYSPGGRTTISVVAVMTPFLLDAVQV